MTDDPRYAVTPYTEDRLPDLRVLWLEQLGSEGAEKRESLFRWLVNGNPFSRGEPAYWLLLQGDRVVGMHGLMPLDAFVAGERRRLHVAHDDLLSASCRGMGLGRVMLEGVAEQLQAFSAALWHNPPNRKLYLKSGWIEPEPGLTPNVLVSDPDRFLRSRLRASGPRALVNVLLRPMFSARRRWGRRNLPAGMRVETIDRFDSRFDEFASASSRAYSILIVRESAYLNWRYVDKPGADYSRTAITSSSGRVIGWATYVARQEGADRTGYVMDWLVDSQEPHAFEALMTIAADSLFRSGCGVVSLLGRPPFFSRSIDRLGFMRSRHRLGFMVTDRRDGWEDVEVTNRERWFITHADGDGDAWTFGDR